MPPSPAGNAPSKSTHSAGLYAIGIYKLFECALLIAAGLGTLNLLHKDLGTVVTHWVHVLRVDPDNRYIHSLMEKAFAVSPKQLKELSFGTFFYALLRFLEGIGLVLRKRWGEYLTIAVTALFIPLEIWEIVRHLTAVKIGVFLVNVAIVVYLVIELRRKTGQVDTDLQPATKTRSA